jgi:hypothetical protein
MAPDARSISGPMLAWAKTTMAKPIAVAANAKPIFRFMGEPSFKSNQNPTPSSAAKSVMAVTKSGGICDGHHKKVLSPRGDARDNGAFGAALDCALER